MSGEEQGLRGGKKGEAWSQPRPAAVSDFPEPSAAQESPGSNSHLPQLSGMEDVEPGWLPPLFPPGSLYPKRGGLGSPLSGPCTPEAPCRQGQPLDESQ